MAGNYPNGPDRRMAYDADGTCVFFYDTAWVNPGVTDSRVPEVLSVSEKADLNKEKFVRHSFTKFDDQAGTRYLVFVFPEDRDVEGIFVDRDEGTFPAVVGAFTGSDDTTNGQDGTWTNIISNVTESVISTYPTYRTSIEIGQATGRSAVRLAHSPPAGGWLDWASTVHLYGSIPLTTTPDRIIFLDADLGADAVFVKPLDFQDVERGTAVDNITRLSLKNNSATLDATTVQVTSEALYLDAGGFLEFSETNGSYQGTLSITSIAADTEKQIYMRRTLTATETLGTQTSRIKVDVTSWS